MEAKKAALTEIEDVIMQHSYPAHTADAHFYQLPTQRDHEMDHDTVGDQLVQQALANLAEHQEQQNQEHENDLRELRALQEPQPDQLQHHVQQEPHEDTRHEDRHPPVSAEELRLAAQLTQDIAPMVTASAAATAAAAVNAAHAAATAAQNHALPDGLPRENPPAPETQDQTSIHPDLQQQLQTELQNHDRALQNAVPTVPAVPSIHEEQTIKSQYESTGPSTSPHPPPIPVEQYARQPLPEYANHPNPRKRTKVSRACDECRRKKIKCDAQTDLAEQPCSNCRRAEVQCLFSRVPQKRGPSKGYIKELADRINSIEGKLGASVAEALEAAARNSATDSLPSPQSARDSRKRTFSAISGDGLPRPIPPAARGPWHAEPTKAPFTWTVNDLAPKPVTPAVLPDGSPMPPHPATGMVDPVPDGLPSDPLQPVEQVREIDDVMFNCYLGAIHHTFPVLASTKARVQSLISQCPLPLQDAFCGAFLDLTRPFTPQFFQTNGQQSSTEKLLADWELDGRRGPWSPAIELLYFQTLVMMVLDSGHRGIAEQSRDAWKSGYLGKAVGLGLSMKLHLARPDPAASPELDPDSDDNVALRAWWVLVMFDQWNAISMGKPLFVSPDTAVLLQGIRHLVGEPGYYLIRLSEIIGSFVPAAQSQRADWGREGNRVLVRLTDQILKGIWEDFSTRLPEDHYPLVHLAYWHARLLAGLIVPQIRLPAIPHACGKILRLLSDNPQLVTPLRNHFVSLSSLVLMELVKVDATRDEALKLLDSSLDSRTNVAVRDKIAEVTRTPTKNLHQLADVASVANGGPTPVQILTASQGGSVGPPPPPPPILALLLNGRDGAGESGLAAAPPAAATATQEPTQESQVENSGSSYIFDSHRFLNVGYLAFLESSEKEVSGGVC